MKTNGNDKALESYKIFPYVAWVTIFAFSFFVYNIAQNLISATEELSIQTQNLQEDVSLLSDQIENLDI